jgi:hypothetical protein
MVSASNLIIAFQTSSTVLGTSLHSKTGRILEPTAGSHSTLSAARVNPSLYALSDIHIHGDTIYILNRQVSPPYTSEGDEMAVFRIRKGKLEARGHIQLPCRQPREIKRIDERTMAVSCVGAEGKSGGIVLVRNDKVAGHWDGPSSWGLELL